MTDLTKDWYLEGTEIFMGGINLVGCPGSEPRLKYLSEQPKYLCAE
jgi:hypothetical protein